MFEPLSVTAVVPVARLDGGAEVQLLTLLRASAPLLSWRLFFLEPGPLEREAAALGWPTEVVPNARVRHLHLLLPQVWRIARAVRSSGTDVVLSWGAKATLWGSLAASLSRRPHVWYAHTVPGPDAMHRIASLLPAAGTLACSAAVAELLEARSPHRSVRVVHPAVDVDTFTAPAGEPVELRRSLDIPAGARVVGVVSRLQRGKRLDVLLAAVAALSPSYDDVHVVVVGGPHPLEPEYGEVLRARAAELGLSDRAHFVGLQSDVATYLHTMDVYVHPSSNEAFGIALVEALAAARPVIAAASVGAAEILSGGQGVLVPPGDSALLAESLQALLADEGSRIRLSAAGQARAAAFAPRQAVASLTRALRSAARERSGINGPER